MDICFEGVGQAVATFRAEGEVLPGMAVTLTGSGAAKVSYTGTAPKAGWQGLACDGKGGVKAVTTGGVNCLVLVVDEVEKTAVIKL